MRATQVVLSLALVTVEVRMYAGGHGDWPVDDLVRFLDRHLKEGRR